MAMKNRAACAGSGRSSTENLPIETDVFIVGGGPAGLAAAIAARQKGFRVTLADRATPPVDKACGEGVMPDGIAALRELGITIPAEQCFPVRGIRFVEGNLAAQSEFLNGNGRGVRRTTLHTLLAGRAEALGVEMHWGKSVAGLNRNDHCAQHSEISLEGRAICARWIIGADGQNSRVRQWVQSAAVRKKGLRYGFRSHFQITPWSDYVEVHWGKHCQIYVTPTGGQELCVAVLTANPRSRLADMLPIFPSIARRLRNALPLTTEIGGVSSSLTLAAVTRKLDVPVALIGDASGTVDAIAGEGLSLAFRQALALADALERNDLTAYEGEHRRSRKRTVIMSRLLVALSRHSHLRHRVLSVFAAQPSLFSTLVAIHTGAPVSSFTALQTIRSMSWKILSARKTGKPNQVAPDSAVSQSG
ncbi:MAG TPA: FAD-dependent monooxygenase [Candidatus Acidoferrales bacterium]|nr:FAD-dependent monooxygenase [Candidatus Acidoferrales bacterium]